MLWLLRALKLERLISLCCLSYDLFCVFELLLDLFVVIELLLINALLLSTSAINLGIYINDKIFAQSSTVKKRLNFN
jgi:hypothetical protein